MKKLSVLLGVIFSFILSNGHAQSTTSANVKVYGNCEKCKKSIQKAAKDAGATEAKWNVDTKMLSLTFDTTVTSSKKIQAKIAAVGYDTEETTATSAAYKKLDECCQYDRKKKKG